MRADELIGPYNIHRDIIEYIFSSDAVIADLTDWNPNVFYELGVAHAIANKTVMIVQAGQKLPFDIHNYRCISYEASATGLLALTHQIAEYLEHLEEWSGRPTNPVQEFKRHDPFAESVEIERLRRELRQKEEQLKTSAPKAEMEKLRREYRTLQSELIAKEQSSGIVKAEWEKLKEQLQVKTAENKKLEKEVARWRVKASSVKEKNNAGAVAQAGEAQSRSSQWRRLGVVAAVALVLGVAVEQLFLRREKEAQDSLQTKSSREKIDEKARSAKDDSLQKAIEPPAKSEEQKVEQPIGKSPSQSASTDIVRLRSHAKTLSGAEVKVILRENDFFCYEYDWNKAWSNPQGKGLDNLFELQSNGKVVFEQRTGLMWQQAGSDKSMTFAQAEEYVRGLNARGFAGHKDWRLPTLEEAMSLMEREEKSDGLYLDNKFARAQSWIWTADRPEQGRAWVVFFNDGLCARLDVGVNSYVCVVR